jgi:hypothetical protein
MKLDFRLYDKNFDSVTFLFDLLRHSLEELGTAGLRRYMQRLRMHRETQFKKLIGFLSADPSLASIIPDTEKHHKKRLSADLPITPSRQWAENKGHAFLALNAGELVLRVALFEGFLKEIHRHALLAKPQLLGHVKPDRTVSLKDLFRGGFERTKAEEISRQVREADRLRTKERAKFFDNRLQLKWGDDACIKRVCALIDLRHQLVHQSPDKAVTPKDIEDLRKLFRTVPRACFDKAAVVYATHFKKL